MKAEIVVHTNGKFAEEESFHPIVRLRKNNYVIFRGNLPWAGSLVLPILNER